MRSSEDITQESQEGKAILNRKIDSVCRWMLGFGAFTSAISASTVDSLKDSPVAQQFFVGGASLFVCGVVGLLFVTKISKTLKLPGTV
jgi:hypothetical protein